MTSDSIGYNFVIGVDTVVTVVVTTTPVLVEGADPVPFAPPELEEPDEPDEPVLGAEGALPELPELDILTGSVVWVWSLGLGQVILESGNGRANCDCGER